MTPHSSIPAWKIPWTEEPGRLHGVAKSRTRLSDFTHFQKTKIMASGPITSWEIDGETVETVLDFILGGFKNHCRW